MSLQGHENGAVEERIGSTERQSSSTIKRTITVMSIAALAGMSLLLTLRKPPEDQLAGLPVTGAPTLASADTKPVEHDAYKSFLVTTESGETVPVCFVDNGFTVQIERRFFQLKMVTVFYVPITLNDIRGQLGTAHPTMQYQEDMQLVCQAKGNTFCIPDASMKKVISALHESSESDVGCDIQNVAFKLQLADDNSFKKIMPSAGTMEAQFQQKSPQRKQAAPLTAQSK